MKEEIYLSLKFSLLFIFIFIFMICKYLFCCDNNRNKRNNRNRINRNRINPEIQRNNISTYSPPSPLSSTKPPPSPIISNKILRSHL